jgi:hypothetical protein
VVRTVGWATAALIGALAAAGELRVVGQSCAGDCDGDRQVAVHEVIACVNDVLVGGPLACAACDVDADGAVAIHELVSAVNAVLAGCPATATPSATAPTTATSTVTHTESPTGTATAVPTDTRTPAESATPTAVPTASASSTPTRTRPTATATRTPTPSPTFALTMVTEIAHAVAEVWVQNVETLAAIDVSCLSAGGCSNGPGSSTASRGVAQPCPGGGTRTETCAAGVQSVVYEDCVEFGADGHAHRRDGRTVLTVADPGFCDDLEIGTLSFVVLELRYYVHVERDAQNVEVARVEGSWVDTLSPRRLGCQPAGAHAPVIEGDQEVRGTMRLVCRSGATGLPCRRGNTDVTLTTAGLQIRRDAEGMPCEIARRIKGALRVVDRDRGLGGEDCTATFTQIFEERRDPDTGQLARFLIAEAPAGDGTASVRQEGRLTVDAFGPVELRTRPRESGSGTPAPDPSQPGAGVRFVDGEECPIGSDAEIEVGRAPSADMTFRFQPSSEGVPQVVFDLLGGDPQGMQTVAGCVGISRLASCE